MFRTEVVGEIKHTFMFRIFFLISRRLWDNVEKYCRAGQAIGDNMAHALCKLDSSGCQHTICNSYCFSTATMVARTRLRVTLFVHYLCCFRINGPLRVQFFLSCCQYDCTVFLRCRHGVNLGQINYGNVRSEHRALESVFALVPCTSR